MKRKILLLSALFILGTTAALQAQTTTVRQLSGTDVETAKGMITDHAGNVIIWGTFVQTLDLDLTANVSNLTAASTINDGYVAKYDSSGTLLWAKDFGGVGSYTAINSVDVDQNNNVYISGAFTGTIDADPSANTNTMVSAGDVDIFITKLNAGGTYMWAKHIGGMGEDQADDIKTNDLDHFYISGMFSDTVDFDPSAGTMALISTNPNTQFEVNRGFIAKYDLDGNIIWTKRIGGLGGKMLVNKAPATNDYVIFYGGGVAYNTTLEDYDPSGNFVSPVPSPLPGANYSILARYDTSGNYVWSVFFRTYTGMNFGSGPGISKVLQDANKNLYLSGSYEQSLAAYPQNILTLTPIGTVDNDAMLVKLDSAGGLIWEKKMGSADAFDYISDMVFDSSGNIHVVGSFGGLSAANTTADFNIPGIPQTLTTNGTYDGFVAAYTTTGNLLYKGGIGGTGSDYMAAIAIYNNKVWLFGGFEVQADCDPFGTANLTSAGTSDLFLNSYKYTAVGPTNIAEHAATQNVIVYPNPASEQLFINRGNELNGTLSITDISGKTLLTKAVTGKDDVVPVSQLMNGIYFYNISDANSFITSRGTITIKH